MKNEKIKRYLQVPTRTLITELQQHFHPTLLKDLAQLMDLFDIVHKKHAEGNPKLAKAYNLFSQFSYRIPLHLFREEQILFPLLIEQENGSAVLTQASFRNMESEHDEDLLMIQAVAELTDNFTPPPQACKSWKKLYEKLENFLSDLELHIAIENDVLFQRFQEKKGLKVAR